MLKKRKISHQLRTRGQSCSQSVERMTLNFGDNIMGKNVTAQAAVFNTIGALKALVTRKQPKKQPKRTSAIAVRAFVINCIDHRADAIELARASRNPAAKKTTSTFIQTNMFKSTEEPINVASFLVKQAS